jgi:inward rectifier potassium channel
MAARPRRRAADPPPLSPETPAAHRRVRMIPRGRTEALQRIGLRTAWWHDLYHEMNTISWPRFLLITVATYLIANVLFAGLYLLQPGAIGQAKPGDFGDAFFFSVQTMATIGYGKLVPDTVYANLLVTLQTVFAMLLLALTTGLMFARFSRPTARILFTRNAVVGRYNGAPVLSFRIANERRNQILQAEVSISMLRTEALQEGGTMRRFYEMKLLRSRTPVFALTFQVMHPIDPGQPAVRPDPGRSGGRGSGVRDRGHRARCHRLPADPRPRLLQPRGSAVEPRLRGHLRLHRDRRGRDRPAQVPRRGAAQPGSRGSSIRCRNGLNVMASSAPASTTSWPRCESRCRSTPSATRMNENSPI